MKKLYLVFIVILMGIKSIHAQDTTSLAGKMQFVFAQLNRSDISTGFLEERAFPLVSLIPFNGILTDSNKVYLNTLRATYFTHYTACMLGTNPMLPVDSLNSSIAQYLPLTDTVPIAIHFGEMNAFKSDAVDNNLVSIDGDDVLHDVPGRLENPYLLKYLFASSPLKSDFATGNFVLMFKPDLFFTNSSLTVSGLYIDFDDGQGYQSASWNTALYPDYTTPGTKNIRLKMVLSNSSQYECYAPITVARIPELLRYASSPSILPKPFSATAYHSGGRAFVRYSSSNSTGHLKKPLIVVEGYDASFRAPNLAGNNYSYTSFVDDLDGSLPDYNFNHQLDDIAGYDLVFIDYNYGTDSIERNANLFQEVLNWVNTDKALGGSAQQNVVMGISMGGLVARYGLAQMTKSNEDTETRLLITHDSPHQGANVPVGLQKLVQALGQAEMFDKKITDVFPQYNEATTVLNEPATLQLLSYRSPSYNGTIQTNTWLTATYKPMVTFSSSDPQPAYRFIATSQGSECGTSLFSAGSQLLNVQGNGSAVIFFIPGLHAKMEAQIRANALPAIGGTKELAKVKFEAKVKYFFIRIKKETFNFSYSVSSSPFLPIDGAPGGTSPIGEVNTSPQSMGGIMGFFLGAYNLNLNVASLSNFAFVPTPSALDVQNYNASSLFSTYADGWSPNNPSSAETFIAQEAVSGTYNESHTRFTARNAEWIFNEMQNSTNTLNCSADCSPNTSNLTITGSYQICNTSELYEVPNLPSGATVTWSTTGLISISGSNTANPVTVTKTANGTGTLTANVSTACDTLTLPVKNVMAGLAPFPYAPVGPTYIVDYGDSFGYDIQAYPDAISYEWFANRPIIPYSYTEEDNWSDIIFPDGGDYEIKVKITTSCGEVISEGLWVEVDYSQSRAFSYFPNPVKNELTVSYEAPKKQVVKGETLANKVQTPMFEIKLLDYKGLVLKSAKSDGNKSSVDISTKDIPDGTYFLHIINKGKTIKKQVVVQH